MGGEPVPRQPGKQEGYYMAYARGEKLHGWYKTVNRCTIREVKSARDAIKSREDNVLNYFIARSTNASAESLNSKMKAFRA
jgi:transposase